MGLSWRTVDAPVLDWAEWLALPAVVEALTDSDMKSDKGSE